MAGFFITIKQCFANFNLVIWNKWEKFHFTCGNMFIL